MAIVTDREVVLIGPLTTTTWTPPESCTVAFEVALTNSAIFRGQKCVTNRDERGSPLQDNPECWPPSDPDRRVDPPAHPLAGWGVYSPGIACPTGYTEACTAIHGEAPEWDHQFRLAEGETAIGCCPEGFACTNSNGNKCVAIATETFRAPTATCSGTDMVSSVMATLTPDNIIATDSDGSPTDTRSRTMTLWAPLFQLHHRSDDLPTATATSEPDSDASIDDAEYEGLRTSEKIGLGIGAAVAALLALTALGWYLWTRRRQKRRFERMAEMPDTSPHIGIQIHEKGDNTGPQHTLQDVHGFQRGTSPSSISNESAVLPGSSWQSSVGSVRTREMPEFEGSTVRTELSDTSIRRELGDTQLPRELPAEMGRWI